MDLDDRTQLGKLDPGEMGQRVSELPQQCRDAWAISQAAEMPPGYGDVRHLVVLGMGGSAIGGALLRDLVAGTSRVEVTVVHGYQLPAFVSGPETLVIACSNSGNTEETLTCFAQALERGVLTAAVTTGGKLAALAGERGIPVLLFDYDSQPRAAVGYSYILLLGLGCRLGLFEDRSAQLDEAIGVMEALQEEVGRDVPIADNAAKSLATTLADRLPVVYGGGFLVSVANRWKTQFNENAKHWSFFEALPELHHNTVVGLGIPPAVRDRAQVLMLRSRLDHPRLKGRLGSITFDQLLRFSHDPEQGQIPSDIVSPDAVLERRADHDHARAQVDIVTF